MKRQVVAVTVACVVAVALAGSFAWAARAISVDVPFSFMVADKELPAGKYEISDSSGNLMVKGSGGSVVAPVIERLADTGGTQPKIVFDKVEGKHYLSEVHIPGADGFLVGIAKGKETHEVLTGKQ